MANKDRKIQWCLFIYLNVFIHQNIFIQDKMFRYTVYASRCIYFRERSVWAGVNECVFKRKREVDVKILEFVEDHKVYIINT